MDPEKSTLETWKAFGENVITHSGAHYLMGIRDLIKHYGYARVSDVARELKITRGSASLAMKTLREKGLVSEDENKFLRLTAKGEGLAQTVLSKRIILMSFFRDVLHVDPEQAEVDSCKIEHLVSKESGEKLLRFLKFAFSENSHAQAFVKAFAMICHDCKENSDCALCEKECILAGAKLDTTGGLDTIIKLLQESEK